MTMPVQRWRHHRGRARNGPRAGFEAAAHRVLAFRATGVLRCIRVRIGSRLAACRHQGGDSRKGDHRPLQSDSEHHDDGDELALHEENTNTQPASALPKADIAATTLRIDPEQAPTAALSSKRRTPRYAVSWKSQRSPSGWVASGPRLRCYMEGAVACHSKPSFFINAFASAGARSFSSVLSKKQYTARGRRAGFT
jgi:hypothetical protein